MYEKSDLTAQLANAKSTITKMNDEISRLKMEESNNLITIEKEKEKHQEEIPSMSSKICELQNELTNIKTESVNRSQLSSELTDKNTLLQEKEAEINKLKIEKLNLEKRLIETPSDNNDSPIEYLKEIVYLYKTLINNAKERIEEIKLKIAKVEKFEEIQKTMSDPKISKDKLKAFVTSQISQFPYFSKVDMKTGFKVITMSMFGLIEHKRGKLEQYIQEEQRNAIVLQYSEPKFKEFCDKFSAMNAKK